MEGRISRPHHADVNQTWLIPAPRPGLLTKVICKGWQCHAEVDPEQ
jgi:hypothetical protein